LTDDKFDERVHIFTALPYFKNLDDDTFRAVTSFAIKHSFEPGQIILLEGEPGSGLYIVQNGWLKVSKFSQDGREQTLQFLGSGEVFNAIGVFTGASNPATVTALEASSIWIIPREKMLSLLDDHPTLVRTIIKDLAERVLHLITLVEDLSLRKVEGRFARLLLEEAQGNVIQRKKWATQTEMAARLGTVPDVISRTQRKMTELGILQVGRGEITILDREKLLAMASVVDQP